MPTNAEIAGWLREAAEFHQNVMDVSTIDCVTDKHSKLKFLFNKRATLVESVRCETCRWWQFDGYSLNHYCSSLGKKSNHPEFAKVWETGPQFSCCHWEEKE